MQKNRKSVGEILHNVKSQKNKHEYLSHEFVRVNGQENYDEIISYYDVMIEKLNREMDTLPIGHRYTGVFYVKIPRTLPVEFAKVEGSVFMRDDLVSWFIEDEDPIYNHNYIRAVFKGPNFNVEIKREDATPVYGKPMASLDKVEG